MSERDLLEAILASTRQAAADAASFRLSVLGAAVFWAMADHWGAAFGLLSRLAGVGP